MIDELISWREFRDFPGTNMKVRVGTPITTKTSEMWRLKDAWLEQNRKSEMIWEQMPKEQKNITKKLVTDSLKVLLENVDDWVPSSLEDSNGEFISVNFMMQFTQIQKEIWEDRIKYEEDLSEAKESVTELLRGIRAED